MKCISKTMSIDYCSVCKTATNMIVTVTPKAIAGKDGKMETITIKSYHCESCRSFIRSTDEKDGTDFDKYLEEQLKDPAFAARFERAGEAWDVALQIAALRQEAGLSQKDLAKLLKVPQPQISRLSLPATRATPSAPCGALPRSCTPGSALYSSRRKKKAGCAWRKPLQRIVRSVLLVKDRVRNGEC